MMKETLECLKNFQGTTLFVTHNMAEAYRLCDRIVVLNGGGVEAIGPKQEIFQHPATLATAKITGCKNTAEAIRRSGHSASVPEWGVSLTTDAAVEGETGFVGVRANNIRLAGEAAQENCFPVWIADESEAPFRTNLYLKIGSAPQDLSDYHIQWEISREERAALRSLPQPFRIHIDPKHTFFMMK
jgi:ABC-type sulfate/molybdate transport systems ATPase subunit